MDRSILSRTVVACVAGSLLATVAPAFAELILSDNFQSPYVVGNSVATPPWSLAAGGGTTVQVDPLNAANQALQVSSSGTAWFDLTSPQQAELATGDKLEIDFRILQQDLTRDSVAIQVWNNNLNNFSLPGTNAVDFEFFGSGGFGGTFHATVASYNGSTFNQVGTLAASGTSWDTVKLIINEQTHTYTASMNGGTPFTEPFSFLQNNLQSVVFGPSHGVALGLIDDVRISIIPEPGSLVLLGLAALGLPAVVRARRRASKCAWSGSSV